MSDHPSDHREVDLELLGVAAVADAGVLGRFTVRRHAGVAFDQLVRSSPTCESMGAIGEEASWWKRPGTMVIDSRAVLRL
jgi:hypothetical protein